MSKPAGSGDSTEEIQDTDHTTDAAGSVDGDVTESDDFVPDHTHIATLFASICDPASVHVPRLTVEMAAVLQGFGSDWRFAGRKTSALPPGR